mgnify:CR=1 FL=1
MVKVKSSFAKATEDKGIKKAKKIKIERVTSVEDDKQKIIEKFGIEDKDKLRKELDELGKKIGDRGLVYWPFRVALSGQRFSPDPVDIAEILGKEKTLERIEGAINKLAV